MDQKTEAEIDKLLAETRKLLAEKDKLHAEKDKLRMERAWYPAFMLATALAAGAALMKVFVH